MRWCDYWLLLLSLYHRQHIDYTACVYMWLFLFRCMTAMSILLLLLLTLSTVWRHPSKNIFQKRFLLFVPFFLSLSLLKIGVCSCFIIFFFYFWGKSVFPTFLVAWSAFECCFLGIITVVTYTHTGKVIQLHNHIVNTTINKV